LILFLIPFSFPLVLPKIEQLQFLENKLDFIKNAITNLSLWSYSIYLSHIPILFTLYYLTDGFANSLLMKLSVKVLGFILTIIVSKWLFIHFETPLTNKRPKEIRSTALVFTKK
jgi:peptidoglycan/LPS O-acetylase OafA/YrhL